MSRAFPAGAYLSSQSSGYAANGITMLGIWTDTMPMSGIDPVGLSEEHALFGFWDESENLDSTVSFAAFQPQTSRMKAFFQEFERRGGSDQDS